MMTKGDDDVWAGELSLPKGTKFDIKILKSTVSATSGGDNAWSAVRYSSTLNVSASHDFGEFTDNLIPNGNFDEGRVKWTPAKCIQDKDVTAISGEGVLVVGGGSSVSCASDVFVIPPNQTLRLTGYIRNWKNVVDGVVTMKIVAPQQQTLFEFSVSYLSDASDPDDWHQFSRTFKTADVPMECQIVLSNGVTGDSSWWYGAYFESFSLVSP